MQLTRRDCLRVGLGSSAVLACGNVIPAFLACSAPALAIENAVRPDRVLVVVELDGGNDGLNTVVPFRDDAYYQRRPTVNVPATSVLKVDDQVGFHPQLRGFADLLERKQLAVVQSVGYPNASRSHFQSMAIWQSGRLDATLAAQGWLSRYVDLKAPAGSLDSPAIQVDDGKLALAFSGGEFQVPTLNRLEGLERRLGGKAADRLEEQRARLDFVLGQERGDPGSPLRFVQQSALVSFASSRRLRDLIPLAKGAQAPYPGYGLAERLKMITQLVRAGLNTTVYYTRLRGFDTHTNQSATHPRLLSELGGSVRAFFDDLTKAGEAERVLVLVFSEFGRRLEENAGGGTDHGTAGPMFVIGPAVTAGVHGPSPNLLDLDDGDPKYAIDFRQVYATILERWLNCKATNVLPQPFQLLPIL
jgi:uncharacterized protein (DUF1501 family)